MANRYWVGGTGTWDNLALLKWSATSGGVGGQSVPTSADTVFFDANSGASTVTIGAGTAICSTLTMTGFTGTLAFGSNSITVAGSSAVVFTGATTYSVTGTPLINITGTGTVTINPTLVTEANAISFTINNAASTVAITGSIKNLTFAGTFTGNLTNGSRTIYGNLTLKTGMTTTSTANLTTFAATSGTQQITSASVSLNFPITFSGTGTYQLQDALLTGANRAITLTSGTFDLNNNTATIGFGFISNSSTVRTIAFGTGQFYLTTISGLAWNVVGTNLTITGANPTVNITANVATGVRQFTHVPTTVSQALAINLNVTAGSASLGFGVGDQLLNNLNFTGFSGVIGNSVMSANARFSIYGNLTMGSGMTCLAGTTGHNFIGTGTQLITSNGVVFDQPINLQGTGTYSLQDAFRTSAARQIGLFTGTFQTNGYSVTCGNFSYNNSGTKALDLSNSTINIQGTGWIGLNTNTTYTSVASSTIVFTTTGTATFSGGQSGSGNQFGTIRMSGLSGTLNLGGSATVARCITLENTVSPCTITNSCTTAFTVDNFNVSGTAGNLVTFNSNTLGTARTINQASGTVNASYLNIQDSTASGGAVWNALNSTNAGNNTGWNFLTANSGNFFMVF